LIGFIELMIVNKGLRHLEQAFFIRSTYAA
jgi:hypothetical protein